MNRARVGRLHVITDETVQRRWGHEELAAAAVAGGADVVQYREKRELPFATRLATARRVVAAAGRVHCVVNDDVDLARQAGAWGVHLGSEDVPPRQARQSWPAAACVGATANDLERALRVAAAGVDEARATRSPTLVAIVGYQAQAPVAGHQASAEEQRLALDVIREFTGS